MLMAAYRPRCPILAITREPQTARQLHLYRGVFPVLFKGERNADWTEDMDQRINYAMEVYSSPPVTSVKCLFITVNIVAL